MMNVTLKTVAAQLWRNPEHFAQQEATGNKRLPRIELALVPGWTRKPLVHDDLDANYKTRPFAAIHPPLPKVASHVRAAQREKR